MGAWAEDPAIDGWVRDGAEGHKGEAMQTALWLLDGTSVPGLEELILTLDGKVARRSGDRADGLRPLDMQFREDDCRLRTGNAPAVMVILRRAPKPAAHDSTET